MKRRVKTVLKVCVVLIMGPALTLYLAGMDLPALQLATHYVLEDGNDLRIEEDEQWSRYMKKHEGLREMLVDYLSEDLRKRTGKGKVGIQDKNPVIEHGYVTGYGLMHGTDATVGGFKVLGEVEDFKVVDGRRHATYNVAFEWNDRADWNPAWFWDRVIRLASHNLGIGREYNFHIKWTTRVEAVLEPGQARAEGNNYPFKSF